MSRYVLMQEQLDSLLEQLKQLTRLNEAKDERIKDLEIHRMRVAGADNADLLSTIEKMEDEIRELKMSNKELVEDKKSDSKRIEELETLLKEERKLREYSETFAKEVELQCAEESMIRELTAELCQLQKDEIEIENKRIIDLQKKLKKLRRQSESSKSEKDSRRSSRTSEREILERDAQLKAVIRRLKGQLMDIYDQVKKDPPVTIEDQRQKAKLETWLKEIGEVMEDLDDIQEIRRDLNYLKYEIEGRRKFSFRHI